MTQKNPGPTVDITAAKSRCPKCLSIKRERYSNVTTHDISGISPDGQEYDQITWRRTKCKSCGQSRVDRELRLVPTLSDSTSIETADTEPDSFF
ncbi:hypothetical protein K227x_62300 [Rubripirellula lacrimiformis]|uniref:Uncharacterized protein n=1 Tax=Rubripirellula lacrimiformis TaxID=1930273 RepID=A0A517NKY5_9BACT|nr:hypothetical protein K227x_62300 [Rubripirellula lacrimiformis]